MVRHGCHMPPTTESCTQIIPWKTTHAHRLVGEDHYQPLLAQAGLQYTACSVLAVMPFPYIVHPRAAGIAYNVWRPHAMAHPDLNKERVVSINDANHSGGGPRHGANTLSNDDRAQPALMHLCERRVAAC
jgi:hypothetical protein